MRIIALQGRHNSGKTATLKKLIEIIDKDNFTYEGVNPKGDVLELCRKRKGDMQYWCSCNGVKIGITTRGNARRYLQADFFTKKKNFSDRDIVVCAIRSSGGTVDFVNEHGTKGLIICSKELVVDDTEADRMDKVNTAQAEAILKYVETFVKETEEEK